MTQAKCKVLYCVHALLTLKPAWGICCCAVFRNSILPLDNGTLCGSRTTDTDFQEECICTTATANDVTWIRLKYCCFSLLWRTPLTQLEQGLQEPSFSVRRLLFFTSLQHILHNWDTQKKFNLSMSALWICYLIELEIVRGKAFVHSQLLLTLFSFSPH